MKIQFKARFMSCHLLVFPTILIKKYVIFNKKSIGIEFMWFNFQAGFRIYIN